MIKAYFENNEASTRAYGLTQWDYGQELRIYGIERLQTAEVHFSIGEKEAEISLAEIQEDGTISAMIPDKLLEEGLEIRAYVYVATADSGETVRTVILPVQRRPRPGDYSSPGDKNLLRQLMEKIDSKADDIKLEEGFLQLMSEKKEIGSRIRIPTGGAGREIEIRNNGEALQWRYTDSNDWNDLVKLEELRGPAGETPEFEIREGHLFAKYKE